MLRSPFLVLFPDEFRGEWEQVEFVFRKQYTTTWALSDLFLIRPHSCSRKIFKTFHEYFFSGLSIKMFLDAVTLIQFKDANKYIIYWSNIPVCNLAFCFVS